MSQAAHAVVQADGDSMTALDSWLPEAEVRSLAAPQRFFDWGGFVDRLHEGDKPSSASSTDA